MVEPLGKTVWQFLIKFHPHDILMAFSALVPLVTRSLGVCPPNEQTTNKTKRTPKVGNVLFLNVPFLNVHVFKKLEGINVLSGET